MRVLARTVHVGIAQDREAQAVLERVRAQIALDRELRARVRAERPRRRVDARALALGNLAVHRAARAGVDHALHALAHAMLQQLDAADHVVSRRARGSRVLTATLVCAAWWFTTSGENSSNARCKNAASQMSPCRNSRACRHVLAPPGAQVVDDQHLVTRREQRIRHMTTDEPAPPVTKTRMPASIACGSSAPAAHKRAQLRAHASSRSQNAWRASLDVPQQNLSAGTRGCERPGLKKSLPS